MKTPGYCPCCGHPSMGICTKCTQSLSAQREELFAKKPNDREFWEKARINDINKMIGTRKAGRSNLKAG